MSDLISRQDALDAIKEQIIARLDWLSDSLMERRGLDVALCVIEDLPSAERTGNWKHYGDKDWLRDDGQSVFIVCSECQNFVLNNASHNWNYCPNCGAKMRGGENEKKD